MFKNPGTCATINDESNSLLLAEWAGENGLWALVRPRVPKMNFADALLKIIRANGIFAIKRTGTKHCDAVVHAKIGLRIQAKIMHQKQMSDWNLDFNCAGEHSSDPIVMVMLN
jgi:hypothetical protein